MAPSGSSSRSAGDSIEVLSPEDVLEIGLGSDILVVDDHPSNLMAYEAALAPLGRTLVLVQSGVEALAKLLEKDFALILLDVTMPGMSGVETARMIRERPRCKGIPIIFITGVSASPAVILEAYEVGAFDFVVKPVLPEVLRAKARVYLQLQERTQQLLRKVSQLREAHERLVASEEKIRERDASLSGTRRLKKLQEATAALAEARTPADVAAVAVRLGAEAVSASAAAMWFARTDGSLDLEVSHNMPPDYFDVWRTSPAGAPAMRVAERGVPMWVENERDFAREAPEVVERARAANLISAFAVLPLVSESRVISVVSFTYEGDHTFNDEERTFLATLVRSCEQALERARLFVTEAEARRAAESVSQRKDEFLAMLGHELRNPLAAMSSALDILKFRDGALGRELSILDRQVGHLTSIVGDLVDVSRITRGTINLRREAVDLAAALALATENARTHIELHQHQLVSTVPGEILLDADLHRLIQVLANLLTNAAKYTPPRGRIEVSAVVEAEHVEIRVVDNGRGIPADLLPHVFDVFVQGERTRGRREGGLGIGLALVRNLVELHGGSVRADSDGPGTGSTFTVRWPRASHETPTVAMRPLLRPSESSGHRVLIVDDNAEAAELLAAVVRAMGHEVMVALDAPTALEIANDFSPAIAVLDIELPVMDGYEVGRRLRQLPSCADTTLIALTGYGQPEDQARSTAAGFAHHLVKPVDIKVLRSLIVAAAAKLVE
ncbi:MAG TPA: response regulator [Kofleriaceae bacterium]|jgi:signal transduction histidine kinase